MTRKYTKKTTEDRLLQLTPKVLKFIEDVATTKLKNAYTPATRLAVCKLILGIQLDKDKRDGKSTSSYEGYLMSKRQEKK